MEALVALAAAGAGANNWLVVDDAATTLLEAKLLAVPRGVSEKRHVATQCYLSARLVCALAADGAWRRVDAPAAPLFCVVLHRYAADADADDCAGDADADHVFLVSDEGGGGALVVDSFWGVRGLGVRRLADAPARVADAVRDGARVGAWDALCGCAMPARLVARFYEPPPGWTLAQLDAARVAARLAALRAH